MHREIAFGRGIRLSLAWDAELPPQIDASHRCASGELQIELEPAGARLDGQRAVTVEAAALDDFADQLARLLDDLSGSATFEPVRGLSGHGDFAIMVTLDRGKGVVSGFLAAHYHDARLTFSGYEIDQSYLQETRRQLRSLLDGR